MKPMDPYGARATVRGGPGFTLVEVVIALAILSLVMLATVTGLRTLANTQASLERQTGRIDEIRSVSSFIREAMESAIVDGNRSRLSRGGMRGESAYLELTPESVAWKSTVLFGEAFGGSYLLRVAREGDELVLRWLEPARAGIEPDWAKADSRVMVEQLEQFKVSFRKEFGGPWLDRPDRSDTPVLVRLQIRAAGRYWPDLICRVQGSR